MRGKCGGVSELEPVHYCFRFTIVTVKLGTLPYSLNYIQLEAICTIKKIHNLLPFSRKFNHFRIYSNHFSRYTHICTYINNNEHQAQSNLFKH